MAVAFLISSSSEIEQFTAIAIDLADKFDKPLALLCIEGRPEPEKKKSVSAKTEAKESKTESKDAEANAPEQPVFTNRIGYADQVRQQLRTSCQQLGISDLEVEVFEVPGDVERIRDWLNEPPKTDNLGRFDIDTFFIPIRCGGGKDERLNEKNRLFEIARCQTVLLAVNQQQTAPLSLNPIGFVGETAADQKTARLFAFRLGSSIALQTTIKQRDPSIQCIVMAIPGRLAQTRIDNNKGWNDLCRDPDLPVAMVINPADAVLDRIIWAIDEKTRQVFSEYQMRREDRERLASELTAGTKASPEFILFMAIATLLACIGLLHNSPAVIIGAMLVAPLMTPLIGAGLAMIQGNRPLFLTAMRAILIGVLISFLIGAIVGGVSLLVPSGLFVGSQLSLTGEMISRSHPNLLDPFVGLAGGLAGGFAVGRDKRIGALAGVAIAAALVPPIATAGLELAICLASAVKAGSFGVLLQLLVGDPAGPLEQMGFLAENHVPTEQVRLVLAPLALFAMNACAVILGSNLGLRLVGMHRTNYPKKTKRWVGVAAMML